MYDLLAHFYFVIGIMLAKKVRKNIGVKNKQTNTSSFCPRTVKIAFQSQENISYENIRH